MIRPANSPSGNRTSNRGRPWLTVLVTVLTALSLTVGVAGVAAASDHADSTAERDVPIDHVEPTQVDSIHLFTGPSDAGDLDASRADLTLDGEVGDGWLLADVDGDGVQDLVVAAEADGERVQCVFDGATARSLDRGAGAADGGGADVPVTFLDVGGDAWSGSIDGAADADAAPLAVVTSAATTKADAQVLVLAGACFAADGAKQVEKPDRKVVTETKIDVETTEKPAKETVDRVEKKDGDRKVEKEDEAVEKTVERKDEKEDRQVEQKDRKDEKKDTAEKKDRQVEQKDRKDEKKDTAEKKDEKKKDRQVEEKKDEEKKDRQVEEKKKDRAPKKDQPKKDDKKGDDGTDDEKKDGKLEVEQIQTVEVSQTQTVEADAPEDAEVKQHQNVEVAQSQTVETGEEAD
ncbi:hypothetical protein [Salinilacihabitans rarus]|uniref:hypothetical protein n=1 Tax=Salinilacihabitans rarus TaxID=2961596 RepID=UPI0020C9154F|nr:hypothetical protein [Salinilacihabitans rarus]